MNKLHQFGKLMSLKDQKPTPVQEAKWGLAVIEDSLWNSIPKICSRLDETQFKDIQANNCQ